MHLEIDHGVEEYQVGLLMPLYNRVIFAFMSLAHNDESVQRRVLVQAGVAESQMVEADGDLELVRSQQCIPPLPCIRLIKQEEMDSAAQPALQDHVGATPKTCSKSDLTSPSRIARAEIIHLIREPLPAAVPTARRYCCIRDAEEWLMGSRGDTA